MIRNFTLAALGVSAVMLLAGEASAQIILPLPLGKQNPNGDIKKLADLLKKGGLAQPGGVRGAKPGVHWGGAKLEKVSPELQVQLGLEENAGLVVTAIDANSVSDKAGLKANDVLIKIGAKPVPSDPISFTNLVKDQKENEPIDLVIIRKGKEETLKGAKMPTLVQNGGDPRRPGAAGGGGIGGAGGGIGGIGGAPGMPGLPGIAFGGLQAGKLKKMHIEMEFNGGDLVKDQDGDKFSGSFTKDTLKITVAGTIEAGQNKISEITIREGKKDPQRYTSIKDAPAQHRATIEQMLPSPFNQLMIFPAIPNLQDFPGLPVIPGFDD